MNILSESDFTTFNPTCNLFSRTRRKKDAGLADWKGSKHRTVWDSTPTACRRLFGCAARKTPTLPILSHLVTNSDWISLQYYSIGLKAPVHVDVLFRKRIYIAFHWYPDLERRMEPKRIEIYEDVFWSDIGPRPGALLLVEFTGNATHWNWSWKGPPNGLQEINSGSRSPLGYRSASALKEYGNESWGYPV